MTRDLAAFLLYGVAVVGLAWPLAAFMQRCCRTCEICRTCCAWRRTPLHDALTAASARNLAADLAPT
jgi:hypothetical protein